MRMLPTQAANRFILSRMTRCGETILVTGSMGVQTMNDKMVRASRVSHIDITDTSKPTTEADVEARTCLRVQ